MSSKPEIMQFVIANSNMKPEHIKELENMIDDFEDVKVEEGFSAGKEEGYDQGYSAGFVEGQNE